MANVPSLRWSALDVLSASRELAKTVDQRKVLQEQGKYFYKIALSEIVTLLNGAVDPSYFSSSAVTAVADIEYLTASVISAINSSTLQITRGTGVFVVGSLAHITLNLKSDGSVVSSASIRITVGGAVATYVVVAGTLGTYNPTTQTVSAIVEKSNTGVTSISIATINFDRIVSLVDSTYGQCIYVTPEEFASLARTDFSHKSYDDDIVWTQYGTTILVRNGSKVTPGTKTIYYQRQPDYPTNFDANDMVDIADKWIPLMIKRIYTLMILQTENDVPHNLAQEMQLDYQQINGMMQAEIANKTKPYRDATGKKTQ